MKLSILAVGKLKSGPERELFERYFNRTEKAGKPVGLTGVNLREFPESRNANPLQRCQEESRLVLSAVSDQEGLILLDETGKDIDSEQFAQLIRQEQESGRKTLHFAIGGADGHAATLQNEADYVIRFGRLTWPHQIVRILLAEQLYRAATILSGHPYHRAG